MFGYPIDDTVPLLYIPTEPLELANILVDYSTDWEESLHFLSEYAKRRGMHIDTHAVGQKVKNIIGEV